MKIPQNAVGTTLTLAFKGEFSQVLQVKELCPA